MKAEEHLGLITFVLNKYFKNACDQEDLYQVGYLELHNVIEKFDESRGLAFSTYAVKCIWGRIARHIRDDKWRSGFGSREERKGRVVSVPVSLSTPIKSCEGKTVTLEERLYANTNYIDDLEEKIYVEELLSVLCDREREVIELLYLKEKTQREVAVTLGVSQAQVSRIKIKALSDMRVAGGAVSA